MARKMNNTNVGTSKASGSMKAGRKTMTGRKASIRAGAGKPTGGTMKQKGKVKGTKTLQKSDPSGVKGSTGTAKIKGGKSPRTYKANLSGGKKSASGKGWRPKGRK